MLSTRIVSVLIGLACLAGLPAEASARASQAAADAKELAAYRLTREGLDKYAATMRALASTMRKDPKFAELSKLEAEVRALESKHELTRAEQSRLDALHEKLEQLEESLDPMSMDDADTLTEMEAQIKQSAPLSAAIKAGGFTAREYAKFTLTLFQAAMVVGMQKAGLMKEVPKDVSPENLKFVQQHEQELEKLQKELEALMPGGGR